MKMNLILLSLVLFSFLTIPISTRSEEIIIEAEDFTDYHDIANDTIKSIPGSGCSGGYILVGLDYPDEWVAYPTDVDSHGVYSARAWFRGNLGQEYNLQLALIPDTTGDTQTIDFTFVGTGFG